MPRLTGLLALTGLLYTATLGAAQTNHIPYDEPVMGRSANPVPIPLDRKGWSVSASGSQQGCDASNLIDGNPNTFWHSGDSSSAPSAAPPSITIDMKEVQSISGLRYTPSQNTSTGTNIGRHDIFISMDGQDWGEPISTGTWAQDDVLKSTIFDERHARYVKIVAHQDAAPANSTTTQARDASNRQASGSDITIVKAPRPYLPRTNWRVSADSFEAGPPQNNPQNAIDGATTTIWHTQFIAANPPLPHYFTIDQGSSIAVAGLAYLPRPPIQSANGRIGRYQVQYSNNGNQWTTASQGAWPDTADLKYVQFAPIPARYWRLVALSEAGNRGPWTAAAEINLFDGRTNPGNWKVTVDSQETKNANNSAYFALDNNLGTFWHSAYASPVSTVNAPLPHTFTIDMNQPYDIYGLIYTPRQDGQKNGNIGRYRVGISVDGSTWTNVASGTFIDDAEKKPLYFGDNQARYIRLIALTEAGNRGPWTSAAEITPLFSSGPAAVDASRGKWGPMIDFPIVPVAVALTAGNRIMAWSAFQALQFTDTDQKETQTAFYDLTTGQVTQRTVSNTGHDMFCPGLSTDFNGRPLVTGGNSASKMTIYQPGNNAWVAGPQMRIPRGYQGQTTLSDGRTFTIGGSWSGNITDKPGEVYNPKTNSWTLMNGCSVKPMLTNDAQGLYRADNHGWLFAWRQATVYQAGPSSAMNWYYPSNGGSVRGAGRRASSPDSMNGIAVMYDAPAGKIFTAGGAPSYQQSQAHAGANIITIGNPGTTSQVASAGSMAYPRAFHNGVALPDGSVFIVGGQTWAVPFTDDTAILYPELWNPRTNSFKTLNAMRVARTYHSVALLLPDATVFSGGGGLCGNCDTNHLDAQIFSPPYLFNANGSPAARPQINSISGQTFRVGSQINVQAPGATAFSLIRTGSATHTVNTDQRRIPLTPAGSPATGSFTLQIPGDPGVALPGNYFLFALNAAGVPSIAKQIKITP